MHPEHPVYTLEDLATWPADKTWLAVLGHPIAHSLSPVMHNAALRECALRDPSYLNWHYVRFDIEPERLGEALPLFLQKGFRGLNLTVPHKVLATSLIQSIEARARHMGAVNTLRAGAEGWEGFNTDGHGMAMGIARDLGLQLSGMDVILLGAGGAARAAAVECLHRKVRSLHILNRSEARLNELLADLGQDPEANGRVTGHPGSPDLSKLPEGALLINATAAGMKAGDPLPVDPSCIARPCALYDMIYNPPRTALLQAGDKLGIPGANGLSMLAGQGARALALWTGFAEEQLAPCMASALSQVTKQHG